MQHVVFMTLQLGALYWLSGRVHQQLQLWFYGWLRTPSRVIWAMNIVFFPGVLIHELAHWVVARLLWVKAGRISLIPKIQSDGLIEMGSVRLPQGVDVFRFALIGLAPVYVGLAVILGIMWVGEHYALWGNWWWWIVTGYTMFEVGNTFFASSSDMAWALRLSIVLGVVFSLLYWVGWRPSVEWLGPWLDEHGGVLAQAERWLWVPVILDGTILGIFGLFSGLAVRRQVIRRG
jgi:hypothetical protein